MAEIDGDGIVFSILMPVYNEFAFVRKAVEKVLSVELPEGVKKELVIVDDGSKDGTRDILKELEEEYSEINLIFHEFNQGKGAAIRTAIEAFNGDIAIFQDADLEYDPNDYGRIIKPILDGRADVCYGSRFAACPERRVLFYKHQLGNNFLTFLSNMFTDLNLTDMETCYKAFRSSVLKTIPIRSNGFGLEPEITAKVAKRNCRVYEVPISYHGRSYEEGKKITWKDGFVALYTIAKYWLIDDCYETRYGSRMLMIIDEALRYSRFVADNCRKSFGRRVLELSGGIGNMSKRITGTHHLIVSDDNDVNLGILRNTFSGRDNVSVEELDFSNKEELAKIEKLEADTVLALDILQSVEDDAGFLKEIHKHLPDNGSLILKVPQFPSLMCPLDEELGYLRRYDKLGLRSLLARNGYEVEFVRDLNWLGVFGWLFNGKILRRKRFGRFQMKIFDSLVFLLRLTSWLPLPGLSIMAVAHKRLDD